MPSLDTALIQAAADAAMITYDTVEKTLVIPEALKTVGVKGDHSSRTITFSLPVKPDLVDLSATTTSIYMDFENALGQAGQYQIETRQTTDGRVIFSLAMPASMCIEKGTVKVGISAYDSEERRWKTGFGTMNLQDSLDVSDITAEDPRYTLLEQVMARLGMSEDDMSGFLKKSEADATYYKKTEPIQLTDDQKAELKGDDGVSPVLNATTEGNSVTVEVTDANGTRNLMTVSNGKDGTSPALTATKSDNGVTTLTVTDADGTRTLATINDGANGFSRFPGVSQTLGDSFTMEPLKEYDFGTITGTHAINLPADISSYQGHFWIRTGTELPTLTFDSRIVFVENFSMEASKLYEFDIWEQGGKAYCGVLPFAETSERKGSLHQRVYQSQPGKD